jgi:hypothetical protein
VILTDGFFHRPTVRAVGGCYYHDRPAAIFRQPGEIIPAMQRFGRGLQLLGLSAPPLAMIMQLAGSISLGQMLTMLVASVCVFGIGRIVEGYAR